MSDVKKSDVDGVSWHKQGKKWYGQIYNKRTKKNEPTVPTLFTDNAPLHDR